MPTTDNRQPDPDSPVPSDDPPNSGSRSSEGGTSRRSQRLRPRSGEEAGLPPGVVVIDKPIGMSSMTVVAIVRRKAGMKAGHAGTLDPLATGVLVVGVGKATKSLERFMKTRKGYRTEIDLSAFTPSDDRESDLQTVDVDIQPEATAIAELLQTRFTGEFLQRPPNFSAKKVDGQRAYAAARKGETPKLEPRLVTVHDIRLEAYEWPIATVCIECEKGFYVRSLARELGQELGTGGHCASIRRISVGPFNLDQAVDPDDLPNPVPASGIIPLEEALQMLDPEPS